MRLWSFLLLLGSICIFPSDPIPLQISRPDCGLFSLIVWFFNKSLFSGGEPDVFAQAWHKPGVTHVWPASVSSIMERNCLTIKQLSVGRTQEGCLPGEGQCKVVSSEDITAQIPKISSRGRLHHLSQMGNSAHKRTGKRVGVTDASSWIPVPSLFQTGKWWGSQTDFLLKGEIHGLTTFVINAHLQSQEVCR